MSTTDVPARVAVRAIERCTVNENGCHISAYTPGASGYALIRWQSNGRACGTRVHRAAWIHHHGPIPPGMTVDHLCREPRCVNVDHLRLLSHRDNSRRNHGADYPLDWSCRRNHPAESRYAVPKGGTRCRECRRETHRRQREANLDRIEQRRRVRKAANPERYRAVARAWREANPEKLRAYREAAAERRAAKVAS